MSRINVRCLLLGLVIGLVGTVPSHIYSGLLSPESSTHLVGRQNVFPMILTRLRTPRAMPLLEQI